MPTAPRRRLPCPALLAFALLAAPATFAAPAGPAAEPPGFDQWLLAPLRVHLLQSTNVPAIRTTLTERDLDRILKKINGIWAQAGLTFWLESIVREDALPAASNSVPVGEPGDLRGLLDLRPAASRDPNLFHLYYVKNLSVNGVYLGPAMFVKDSASLRYIPGGIDEPIPRVSSHELGHALSLQHSEVLSHLMARGTTGTNFDAAQIRQARAAAQKIPWIESAPDILGKADALPRNSAATRALYRRVAVIPLEHESIRRARERSGANGSP